MTVVRVLLVDDQAPFLRAMGSVVGETAGFQVVGEASSGEESILAAAELLPDLVLMDVNLAGHRRVGGDSAVAGATAAAGGAAAVDL